MRFAVLAAPDSWFTYYYWLDDDRAPDFARSVDIHRKPGFDPAELFFDHTDPVVRLRAAAALGRKRLGLRYTMSVISLDPSQVQGSHGRADTATADAPVLICSDATQARDRVAAADVKGLLLRLADLTPTGDEP